MADRTHYTAAIVAVGDEIVRGEKLDTNSGWLSAQLTDRGIEVVEHATADDDTQAIARILRNLRIRCDLVIVTGGLGPTADDLTRKGLADSANLQLIEDADALAEISTWFERTQRPMPRLNRVQAMKPEGSACITNNHGTAPGLMLRGNDDFGDIFCLPGPPSEMRPMFERYVGPRLRVADDRAVATRLLHTIGIGEADAAELLGDLMDRGRNPVVGTTASGGIVTCRLRFTGESPETQLDALEIDVRRRLSKFVFGSGDETIASVLVNILRERNSTLCTVESCTGGLVGAEITAVPRSSDVFKGGWVTYSNEMKTKQVGVPLNVIENDGAVSRSCAEAMAIGGLARANAECCVAVTGIAGPDGGSNEKPVGTVWIAVATKKQDKSLQLDTRRFHYPTDREGVRRSTTVSAMAMIRLSLINDKAQRTHLLFEQESAQSTRPLQHK